MGKIENSACGSHFLALSGILEVKGSLHSFLINAIILKSE